MGALDIVLLFYIFNISLISNDIFLFQGKVGRWTRAYHLKVPPPPMPPQPARGGPRQRILPTPRGVNMIIWSLDNRFVLAAIMGQLFSTSLSNILENVEYLCESLLLGT